MGIVRKQSIIGSIWVYAGAALGFITSAILLPRYFTQEQIGLLSLLVTYGVLFAQFASAGFLHTINRLFPYFRDDSKRHNGFLFFALLVVSIASIILIGIFYIVYPLIISNSSEQNNLFSHYAYLIIPLFIAIVYFNILDFYNKALFNATRGIFLKEIVLRICILLCIALYIFEYITFHAFVYSYIVSYIFILIYIIIAIFFDKQLHLQPDFSLLTKPMRKEIRNVSLYGLLISAAGFIILNIDRIMIEKLVIENPLAQVGIYATCTYFSTMIILPSRPLLKIASTLVAEAWKRGDMEQISKLYTKSTITQSIIGLLVFAGIIVNIENIFYIIPQNYKTGMWVILWIGLFYVSDMVSGLNNTILGASPKYKSLSVFTGILIVAIILLNFIFIPLYGITGAALASCIAKIAYNISTFFYLKSSYKLQPYSYKHIQILIIATISTLITYYLPHHSNILVNIIIKSSIVTILYCTGIYILRVSDDVQELIDSFLVKIKKR
ncbi:MAG TPA: polysaccharide biosynthesis C-terminal domain-containing protein [Bacteroidales bacterium]|jgi:O-antigen/teichoic acid export membrane protein|nr:polysaccharide biosynthesis C-terminal domain-containing protein [Bacteroidales bacterium]